MGYLHVCVWCLLNNRNVSSKVREKWSGYSEFAHDYYGSEHNAAGELRDRLHVLAGCSLVGSMLLFTSATICGYTASRRAEEDDGL